MFDDAPQALADRRSADIANLALAQIQCLQDGIVPVRAHTLPRGRTITRADQIPTSATPTPDRATETHTKTPTQNTMIDDVPQALADRRSADIADLVVPQIQCLQGGIVPVRAHTLHAVG